MVGAGAFVFPGAVVGDGGVDWEDFVAPDAADEVVFCSAGWVEGEAGAV